MQKQSKRLTFILVIILAFFLMQVVPGKTPLKRIETLTPTQSKDKTNKTDERGISEQRQ